MPSPLSYNSPGRAAARRGEFPCTPWLFSINIHALLKEKRIELKKIPEKNAKEGEKE